LSMTTIGVSTPKIFKDAHQLQEHNNDQGNHEYLTEHMEWPIDPLGEEVHNSNHIEKQVKDILGATPVIKQPIFVQLLNVQGNRWDQRDHQDIPHDIGNHRVRLDVNKNGVKDQDQGI